MTFNDYRTQWLSTRDDELTTTVMDLENLQIENSLPGMNFRLVAHNVISNSWYGDRCHCVYYRVRGSAAP